MNNASSTRNTTRIVFAGTPDFAVPSLQALVDICATNRDTELVAVYTQPDRRAGRGRHLRQSDIKKLATSLELPVIQPQTLRDPEAQAVLRELKPDLMVVAAYGLLLPPVVLSTPRLGCVNVHASLLPRWRGAAPVQKAIIAGDEKTGVTLMQMNAGLDTGDMLGRREIVIGAEETGGELTARLAQLGGQLLLEEFDNLMAGQLQAVAQNDDEATLAPKIKKSAARIDWQQPAADIARQIRAYNPWPVAETTWSGGQLRLWSAELRAEAATGEPGRVTTTAERIDIATGKGVLTVRQLQTAGKRVMTAREFLNAHELDGQLLGQKKGQNMDNCNG